jgi:hypothetical protein
MTTGFFGLFETKIDTEGTFSKRHGNGNIQGTETAGDPTH